MSTDKITFLLNWRAMPYHAPIFLAQAKGYFADEGIKVAILEPSDPSDVTELIGSGKADLGCKAMIHTIAGSARGFPIKSIGTLVDEPFTGIVYLEGSGITADFTSLKGKRIGYVGEFGKIQIDELTRHFGMRPEDYTAVRVGMNVTDAIIRGDIDAGVGLENVQMVELEAYCVSQSRPASDVKMLRIDELAELGCCCFCSILYIGNLPFLSAHPDRVRAFMRAIKRANDHLLSSPHDAWADLCRMQPGFKSDTSRRIFERSFVYFSRDCANVERDWNKVTKYAKRLGVVDEAFKANMTNEFLEWELQRDVEDPKRKQEEVKMYQDTVAGGKGILSGGEAPRFSEGVVKAAA
ncbi:Glycylpeptide N-tetradecanoyltransferase [Thecaphora frezii]